MGRARYVGMGIHSVVLGLVKREKVNIPVRQDLMKV